MLNRTNRTLSANLNRLNLGTRSLANHQAGAVNVAMIQRTVLGPARKSPAPIGILDPSDPSILGSRWDLQVPSSPCWTGRWPVGGPVEVVVAELPPDGREVVSLDVPASVPVVRPGGLALARRQPAPKRLAATWKVARTMRGTAARVSACPIAHPAMGG